jgi:hypothetical protein
MSPAGNLDDELILATLDREFFIPQLPGDVAQNIQKSDSRLQVESPTPNRLLEPF